MFDRIEWLGKPVVAAVGGFALGGGCELALACHVRVASENASLGTPEVKLGLFGAAFLSFPVVAIQIYKFVAPGLYRDERAAFRPYLVATPVLFLIGACVVYFIAMPLLVRFSVGFEQIGGEGQAVGKDRTAEVQR